jgi:hypothetical protein
MPLRPMGEWMYIHLCILDLATSWWSVVRFTPRLLHPPPLPKDLPVPIRWEAGWAPEPAWTTWRGENSLSLPGLELQPLGSAVRSQ